MMENIIPLSNEDYSLRLAAFKTHIELLEVQYSEYFTNTKLFEILEIFRMPLRLNDDKLALIEYISADIKATIRLECRELFKQYMLEL